MEKLTATRTHTILVFDDDPYTRQQVSDWLQSDEYAVMDAADGDTALEACNRSVYPSLVLVDGVMAGMDGFEFCRRLRELPHGADIAVIVTSNLDDESTVAKAFDAGADDYMLKPLNAALLRHRVRQTIDMRERLRISEERQQAISSLSTDYAYALDVDESGDTSINWVTDNLYRITGYSEEELRVNGWQTLVHPDDGDIAAERSRILMSGQPHTGQFRVMTKSGEVRWLSDRTYPIVDDVTGRVVRLHGLGRDITDWHEAEAALRTSEQRLSLALDAAEEGLWDWHIRDDDAYFSPRWMEMLGYGADELPHTGETWKSLIHPDDLQHVLDALHKHIEDGEPYDVEHRLKTKSGEWKWIQARGKIVTRDDEGRGVRMAGTHKDIDGRKRMEEVLRQNQERLRTLVENISDIVYSLDFDGKFTYVSPNWRDYLGHNPDDVVGRHFAEFVHPDDVTACQEFLERVIESGSRQRDVRYRVKHLDGSYHWHTSSGSLARDKDGTPLYYVGAAHDITEQYMAEKTSAENEERYRIISNTISDYAYSYIVGEDGSLRKDWSTDAFHNITGYGRDEMDGTGWAQLIHPDDRELAEKRFVRLLKGEVDVTEFRIITRRGEIRWLLDHGYPVVDKKSGRVTRIYGAAQDITQRKQAEEMLRLQTEELTERNEELDAFAYTVAHDLKNPIASMMGFASLVQNYYDRMDDATIKEYIGLIMESGEKLKEIINALLILAGASKMDNPEMSPLDMRDIVEQAKSRLVSSIDERGAKIHVQNHFPMAEGYGPWVEEIWANYLSNAVKYGGDPPEVEVGGEVLDNGMVRFWVQDNGDGLNDEERDRVFTPFTRLSEVAVEGHGLGLSVVQRIVERLGGTVGVESPPGAGARFHFTLPPCQTDPGDLPASAD